MNRLLWAWPAARRATLVWMLALACATAPAIENPDAPDYVAEFETRMQVFEQRIESASTERAAQDEYVQYEHALDGELNAAYRTLAGRLEPGPRAALAAAQRRWLAWRDAERGFIGREWTTARHGSSSALSRPAHRCALLKERTRTLLAYLKEQPLPAR